MASRTKQKEEARARRVAEEQARAVRARQQRRVRMVGGIVVGAIAVIAVAIAISSSGGSSSTGLQKGVKASKTEAQVQQLLNGIPQSGNVLGKSTAPVKMIYFGDLQCPICKDFTLSGGFPQLLANEVRQGKVKIEYRGFQTATPDPNTFRTQQIAALAAGKQKHFWDYAELFYREQGQEGTKYVTESYLDALARQIPGLNLTQWKSDRNDSTLANQERTDQQSGTAVGVSGTPTLIFEGPSGKQVANQGVPSYGQLQKSIQSVE